VLLIPALAGVGIETTDSAMTEAAASKRLARDGAIKVRDMKTPPNFSYGSKT